MPNIEKINELIDWIKADQAKHFKMQGWAQSLENPDARHVRYESCDTAFCLGGHVYFAKLVREGNKPDEINLANLEPTVLFRTGAEELGISYDDASSLFTMDGGWMRSRFDILPDKLRAKGAIQVLTNLRDAGEVDWTKAMDDADINLGDDDDDDD